MELRAPEIWQELDELVAEEGEAGACPDQVSSLVDRLLLSVEDILASGVNADHAERRALTVPSFNSPAQRLAALTQRVEGLAPPARQVMQRVLDEITAQLMEIKRLSGRLHERAAQHREARLAAEQHSMTDSLTGLLNRRGFDRLARKAFEHARTQKGRVLMLFVDMDGMKKINDERGHEAGDRALQSAAEALRRSFRAQDLIARLGGDEFAVLSILNTLPVEAVAERIRLQAIRVGEEHPADAPILLSVGIVQDTVDSHSRFDDLLARADHAMYQRKRERRARNLGRTPAPEAPAGAVLRA